MNALTLRIIHGNGVTAKDAIEEMKDIIEDKRRELLRLVLQEKGSTVPRSCKVVFWKMVKVLHLVYMKDDGFVSNELISVMSDVFEKPVVL